MPNLPISDGVEVPLEEVELRVSRSSGPGGQHANVTASRVEAIFDVHASQALSEEQKAKLKMLGVDVDQLAAQQGFGAAPPQEAAAASDDDVDDQLARLAKLGQLRDSGVLTPE